MVKISEELGDHNLAMVTQSGKHVGGCRCVCLGDEDVGAGVTKDICSPVDRVDCGQVNGWTWMWMGRTTMKRSPIS